MDDEAMREGSWHSDSEMTSEQETNDRRFLDSLVATSPGPAYQWRMEVAVSIEVATGDGGARIPSPIPIFRRFNLRRPP